MCSSVPPGRLIHAQGGNSCGLLRDSDLPHPVRQGRRQGLLGLRNDGQDRSGRAIRLRESLKLLCKVDDRKPCAGVKPVCYMRRIPHFQAFPRIRRHEEQADPVRGTVLPGSIPHTPSTLPVQRPPRGATVRRPVPQQVRLVGACPRLSHIRRRLLRFAARFRRSLLKRLGDMRCNAIQGQSSPGS